MRPARISLHRTKSASMPQLWSARLPLAPALTARRVWFWLPANPTIPYRLPISLQTPPIRSALGQWQAIYVAHKRNPSCSLSLLLLLLLLPFRRGGYYPSFIRWKGKKKKKSARTCESCERERKAQRSYLHRYRSCQSIPPRFPGRFIQNTSDFSLFHDIYIYIYIPSSSSLFRTTCRSIWRANAPVEGVENKNDRCGKEFKSLYYRPKLYISSRPASFENEAASSVTLTGDRSEPLKLNFFELFLHLPFG